MKNMTEKNILIDTSCLIAYFNKETGYENVKARLFSSNNLLISSVSLVEIMSVIGKIDIDRAYTTVEYLENSPIKIMDVNKDIAKLAGTLKLKYPLSSLSTADCIILASGIKHAEKVITRDGFWKDVKEIQVEII